MNSEVPIELSSQEITRKSASNLALAFVLLPKPRRQAMQVVYAFCREVDDVADDESVPVQERKHQLQLWREDLERAFGDHGDPHFVVNRELRQVLKSFNLQKQDFLDLMDGVETDLEQSRFRTYKDLEQYCYRVASAVGLLSIPVFGFKDPSTRDYAVELGKALQITNILRDIKTDGELGRIYLAQDDLDQFGVSEEQILNGQFSEPLRALSEHYAEKAIGHYRAARKILKPVDRKSMIAAELMGAVYWRILTKLQSRNFNLWDGNGRTRLTKLHKIGLIFRTWFNLNLSPNSRNYGPAK